MPIDCRKCGTTIEIPQAATEVPGAVLVCPGCGARYVRRASSRSAATSRPEVAITGAPNTSVATGGAAFVTAASATAPARAQGLSSLHGALTTPNVATATGGAAPSGTENARFRPDDLVAGRYRIRRFVARGGMGEVYEAEDGELRQVVALKTVQARDATHRLTVERFKREIHLARRVTHPNVCRIYDVGYHSTPEGTDVIFLSMEFLDGETLGKRIQSVGALPLAEAKPIALQMADALAAAHDAGVVHRDFKSENVFLVPAPGGVRVVVTDFGVARGLDSDAFAAGVTLTDAAVGTPAYMAPEQVEGEAVTPAIDQYALGVVLFEMTTGALPFAGDTPIATAVKRLSQPAPSAATRRPDLDPRWVAVIDRCLARRAEDRFGSAREVRAALADETVMVPPVRARETTAPVTAPIASPPVAAPASTRRRRLQLALLALVTIALVFAVFQATVRIRRSLQSPFAGLEGVERRAVAVVPFRNLARREEFDWLSVALAEMVATEVRASRGLRTIPGDAVARARLDLGLEPDADLDPASLGKLRSRLGADYVVDGSFTVVGTGDAANVRLAVRIDDARRGELVGEAVETGAEGVLFELVGRLGGKLREALGVSDRIASADPSTVTPANPLAARLYAEGLAKLRTFEPQAALERLERARDVAPDHPMIRSALAATWRALGFEEKARAESAEALRLGAGLPPEERFAVEAEAAELAGDWSAAANLWAKLHAALPDSLDYGLKLAGAQVESRAPEAALATVAALRLLPEPDGKHPGIDLAEASAAAAIADFPRQLAAAQRGAAVADERGAPLLAAEAHVRAADAQRRLGRLVEAEAEAAAAEAAYSRAGDRAGRATALTALAAVLLERGDLAASREASEGALAAFRQAGDRTGTARALNALAVLARNEGDPELARSLYGEALSALEETGNRRGEAYTRGNLSAALAEAGELAEARSAAEAALATLRELGDRSGVADMLLNLGILDRRSGDLDAASARLDEALGLQRELGLRSAEAATLSARGAVSLDRGAIADASSQFESSASLARETDSRSTEANAIAGAAETALERDDFAAARNGAAEALRRWRELGRQSKAQELELLLARIALDASQPREALERVGGVSLARDPVRSPDLALRSALLRARAEAALGRASAARRTLDGATELVRQSESADASLSWIASSLALELAGAGAIAPDAAAVTAEVIDARRRGFVKASLEVELLSARRDLRVAGRRDGARTRLRELSEEAARAGLARLARLADEAAEAG